MRAAARVLGALACSLAAFASQNDAPPPAVARDGVVNAASNMPPQFNGGAFAPGSLVRIRGWRFGPAAPVSAGGSPLAETLAGIAVEVRHGDQHAVAFPIEVGDNEIEALLPANVPTGLAELVVLRNGESSLPVPIRIVPSSFGAFSVNRAGSGPGLILNGPGATNSPENSPERPARPGETVTLRGTGLGALHRQAASEGVSITAGQRSVTTVRYAGRSACCVGTDEISFDLPSDTPEGCYVPVQVRTEPDTSSNVVTISVNRNGRPCDDPGNWLRRELKDVQTAGLALLLRADMLLTVDPRQTVSFVLDSGSAKFLARPTTPSAAGVSNIYPQFPPYGTCTGYSGRIPTSQLLSLGSLVDMVGGTGIDAGAALTVERGSVSKALNLVKDRVSYGGVLGGNAPYPGVRPSPLFLHPGGYRISGAGGKVGRFATGVKVTPAVQWTNREQLSTIYRSQGTTVEWKMAHSEDSIVVVAMNLDSDSGAFGLCQCFVEGRRGRFHIPPSALANIPNTQRPDELPLNLLIVAEVPGRAHATFAAPGLDRGVAFFVSLSGRTVEYR